MALVREIDEFMASKSDLEADHMHEMESTYRGFGFLVDLTGLDDESGGNAGFGGGPLIANPLSGSEAGRRRFMIEVA